MQISPGDAQAAGGQRLVAVVFADGGDRQFDLVVAKLAFKGAGGMVIGNIDNVVDRRPGRRSPSVSSMLMLRSSARTVLPGPE